MKTLSFWIETEGLPQFSPVDQNLDTEVVVVGGGITGITAAYLLAREGKRVVLLERKRLATGESGHTTAHLTGVMDVMLQDLVRDFDKERARAAWEAGFAAISEIELNAQTEGIDCDFRRVPGYLVAALFHDAAHEADSLRAEAELGKELGFDLFYQDSVPGLHRPGVRVPNQGKFHVRKYLAGLLNAAVRRGVQIFEQSEASGFEENPKAVISNGRRIRCEHIVIATHALLSGLESTLSKNLLQTKLAAYNTYAIGARLPSGRMPEALYWDTNDPYYYLRIERMEGYDYAIWGGEDHKTGQEHDTESHFTRLREALLRILPEAEPDRRWSGQVIETYDGLPYIGCESTGQFLATGYAGNGMTFGTLAAMMARDAILGRKNPWSGLFDPHRKNLSASSILEYVRENKDYPLCFIKDHLFGVEVESIDDIQPGEGKIAGINGSKLAVYRKPDGELVTLSPVCPHLGCIVAWNAAAQTWDCPCHGSRFGPTGQVMTGPAESSLEPQELPAATK